MHLTQFRLLHFKNYTRQDITCSPQLNCFVGRNGAGKTNLLEAVYYLCMGKSYFNLPDIYMVQHDAEFFRLEGTFQTERTDQIVIKVAPRRRKEIERNGVAYQRLSEHVGRYPVVIIVPDDTELVQEGSELRRRLLDNTLSQLDPTYLTHLIHYNHLLRQRNALLKQYDGRRPPGDLLEVYDQQLLEPARYIFDTRRTFAGRFAELLRESYAAISGDREPVSSTFKSQLLEHDLLQMLRDRREKDAVLQRTTAGIHRDDLVFTMYDEAHPLKRVASQGQLKSFVLALKLAQYQILRREKGTPPILLLDDIFDKLDRDRVRHLLELILRDEYGQIFISDTDPDRVQALAEALTTDFVKYHVEGGVAARG